MFYAYSINLCGRFVTLPDLLTLGICTIILGVCSALAEISAAGVVSCTTVSDSSTVVVVGHSIRTLYPNKIIVTNKLLGLLRLKPGVGFGSGFILYA